MVDVLYPRNLKGLGLNFAESIFAIAFNLGDDIRRQGKEAVFGRLDMSTEEMGRQVDCCLNDGMRVEEAYALRRVLGDMSPLEDEEDIILEKTFRRAIEKLQSKEKYWQWGYVGNYRLMLLSGKVGAGCSNGAVSPVASMDTNIKQLYAQVQRLMDEVRAYDEKRDLALVRIEELMKQIQQRQDCPKDFVLSRLEPTLCEIEANGPISQIPFPCRSIEVLCGLGLATVGEAVRYFDDFNNFVKGRNITMMEWLVITTILRKYGLLSTNEKCTYKLDTNIEVLKLSVRLRNCLNGGKIDCFGDMVERFADGAADGWQKIGKIRNFGRGSLSELTGKLSMITIDLEESFCYPTVESDVRALDFDSYDMEQLSRYGINKVDELLACYWDENRFFGLRHLDVNLYDIVSEHLEKYGFLN